MSNFTLFAINPQTNLNYRITNASQLNIDEMSKADVELYPSYETFKMADKETNNWNNEEAGAYFEVDLATNIISMHGCTKTVYEFGFGSGVEMVIKSTFC